MLRADDQQDADHNNLDGRSRGQYDITKYHGESILPRRSWLQQYGGNVDVYVIARRRCGNHVAPGAPTSSKAGRPTENRSSSTPRAQLMLVGAALLDGAGRVGIETPMALPAPDETSWDEAAASYRGDRRPGTFSRRRHTYRLQASRVSAVQTWIPVMEWNDVVGRDEISDVWSYGKMPSIVLDYDDETIDPSADGSSIVSDGQRAAGRQHRAAGAFRGCAAVGREQQHDIA